MTSTHIVVGLGFGDEGKGSWVDHLVRAHDIKYVVRFNGGAQARHHVVTPDGRLHGFSQFGSGSLVPGVNTLLSRFMLVEPQLLLDEASALMRLGVDTPLAQLFLNEDAPIITPFNRLINQIKEVSRGSAPHGSCGLGIQLTQVDVEELGEGALYARDLTSNSALDKLVAQIPQKLALAEQFRTDSTAELIEQLKHLDLEYYTDLYRHFATRVQMISDSDMNELIRENDSVFEGAQGVLLDQQYGFFPHCTRSNTTFQNALEILDGARFAGSINKIGLLRGYGTRHGAGPFLTEDDSVEVPSCHNGENRWQGAFRLGWFDVVCARYALEVVGGSVDTLAITNLDRMNKLGSIRVATHFEETDERFFEGSRMKVLTPDLQLLTERTKTFESLRPVYEVLNGWSSSRENMEKYLVRLETLLGHLIHAYSVSADHNKIYKV